MKRVILITLMGIATGCTSVKSSAVNTDGMYAKISAIADGEKTEVEVVLTVGDAYSNTYVELDGLDSLEASDGATSEELRHFAFGTYHSYSADFDEMEAETEFTISFTRDSETSAPASVATLTDAFVISNPTDSVHSRSDDLHIPGGWTSADMYNFEMYIKLSGSCIYDISTTTENYQLEGGFAGYTISASEFDVAGEDDSIECEVTLLLERRSKGTLDPAFGAGEIYGGYRQTMNLRLNP